MATPEMEIVTRRMRLQAASEPILDALINDPRELARILGVRLAADWPPLDNMNFMRSMLERLRRDSSTLGWGPWMMLLEDERTLIGDAGFIGKPDSNGVVEIGYGVAAGYRNRGLATEAATALIEWALRQGATTIIAECDRENLASVHVLHKAGLREVGRKGPMISWQLERD